MGKKELSIKLIAASHQEALGWLDSASVLSYNRRIRRNGAVRMPGLLNSLSKGAINFRSH